MILLIITRFKDFPCKTALLNRKAILHHLLQKLLCPAYIRDSPEKA